MRTATTLIALFLSIQCGTALAQDDPPKSIIAIVGDADRFTIGQGDFCDDRTEVSSPSGKQFRIPANKQSFFFIQSKVHSVAGAARCEGDFSFIPSPGLLHIIRFTMNGNTCRLEIFESEPGGAPIPMAYKREQSRSCLFR
jgi:hypothetical protein